MPFSFTAATSSLSRPPSTTINGAVSGVHHGAPPSSHHRATAVYVLLLSDLPPTAPTFAEPPPFGASTIGATFLHPTPPFAADHGAFCSGAPQR
ncbi:hypothetical protein U1Q18_029222 [Sarracenia purpurea var. burkii]